LSARGQYNIRDTFITVALSAGEDPGWVAQVCGTSEQMIFRHYRNWMPKLRRGDGQLLAKTMATGPKIGPEIGPEGDQDEDNARKISGLRQWRRGELNPRPEAVNLGVYVRSRVFCSRR
jgi:hypothetical protein